MFVFCSFRHFTLHAMRYHQWWNLESFGASGLPLFYTLPRGWWRTNGCPSGIWGPRFASLDPQPSEIWFSFGSAAMQPTHSHPFQRHTERLAPPTAPTPNLTGVPPGLPSLPPVFTCHFLLFGPLPLRSLVPAIFAGNCSITCLDFSDTRTISGLRAVSALESWNVSSPSRCTFSCQSRAAAKSPPVWCEQ